MELKKQKDGSSAFCLHAEKNWQYNVFKTGELDAPDRISVEDVIEKCGPIAFSKYL